MADQKKTFAFVDMDNARHVWKAEMANAVDDAPQHIKDETGKEVTYYKVIDFEEEREVHFSVAPERGVSIPVGSNSKSTLAAKDLSRDMACLTILIHELSCWVKLGKQGDAPVNAANETALQVGLHSLSGERLYKHLCSTRFVSVVVKLQLESHILTGLLYSIRGDQDKPNDFPTMVHGLHGKELGSIYATTQHLLSELPQILASQFFVGAEQAKIKVLLEQARDACVSHMDAIRPKRVCLWGSVSVGGGAVAAGGLGGGGIVAGGVGALAVVVGS